MATTRQRQRPELGELTRRERARNAAKNLTNDELKKFIEHGTRLEEIFHKMHKANIITGPELATRQMWLILATSENAKLEIRVKAMENIARTEGMYLVRARRIAKNVTTLSDKQLVFECMQALGAEEVQSTTFEEWQQNEVERMKQARLMDGETEVEVEIR